MESLAGSRAHADAHAVYRGQPSRPPTGSEILSTDTRPLDSAFAGLTLASQTLLQTLRRPILEHDRELARNRPFYDRGDWQDDLAFGARSAWRRSRRCAAAGGRGSAAAYGAAAGLGMATYFMGGVFLTLPVACARKNRQTRRETVYEKPRTDDGVREDMMGRALAEVRQEAAHLGVERSAAAASVSAAYRTGHAAACATLLASMEQMEGELAESSLRLRASQRLARSIKQTRREVSVLASAPRRRPSSGVTASSAQVHRQAQH